jgi:TrmH family RNA methyltransferase
MKPIESRSNPLFKQLYKWQSSAGRRGEPVLLDGIHLCESWLAVKGQPQYAIFDLDRINEPGLKALIEKLNVEVCISMPGTLLRSLTSVDTDQGVLFVVQPKVNTVPLRLKDSVVMLDRIQDPGNVGAILRSCAAAGIGRVLAATGTAGLWSPKVLRSGQGAHFALQLHEQVDLISIANSLEMPLVVTTLEDAQDLFETQLPEKCAWVFGNEGQGVDPALIKKSDVRVRISHELGAIESLNVTAAAAICLFEQRRQFQKKPAV